jgi:hypothetical protein
VTRLPTRKIIAIVLMMAAACCAALAGFWILETPPLLTEVLSSEHFVKEGVLNLVLEVTEVEPSGPKGRWRLINNTATDITFLHDAYYNDVRIRPSLHDARTGENRLKPILLGITGSPPAWTTLRSGEELTRSLDFFLPSDFEVFEPSGLDVAYLYQAKISGVSRNAHGDEITHAATSNTIVFRHKAVPVAWSAYWTATTTYDITISRGWGQANDGSFSEITLSEWKQAVRECRLTPVKEQTVTNTLTGEVITFPTPHAARLGSDGLHFLFRDGVVRLGCPVEDISEARPVAEALGAEIYGELGETY